jgi:hypothetical protein
MMMKSQIAWLQGADEVLKQHAKGCELDGWGMPGTGAWRKKNRQNFPKGKLNVPLPCAWSKGHFTLFPVHFSCCEAPNEVPSLTEA